MTVSAQTPINRSAGNGVTTVFPYTFKIIAAGDIEVSVDDFVKTLNVDYTVTGAGVDGGGNVTMTVAPASGTTVVRRRNMAFVRATDYQDQGALPAATLDNDIDAPVMMIQQLSERLDRTFSLPASSSADSRMPTPTAGYVLGWDALGETLTNLPAAVGTSLIDLAASTGSALSGHIAEGVGSVATTVQTKLRESVSVKDFGAVGDGVTNDTAAFNLAITAAGASGTVFVPSGTYIVNAITPAHAINLVGSGMESTVLKCSASASFVLALSGLYYCKVSDLSFDGNSSTSTGVKIYASSSIPSQGQLFESVRFKSCLIGTHIDTGLGAISQADKNLFIRCRWTDNTTGFWNNSVNGQNQCIIGGSFDTHTTAIRLTAGDMTCIELQVQVATTAFLIDGVSALGLRLIHVYTEGTTNDIYSSGGHWPQHGVYLDQSYLQASAQNVYIAGSARKLVASLTTFNIGAVTAAGNDALITELECNYINGAAYVVTGSNNTKSSIKGGEISGYGDAAKNYSLRSIGRIVTPQAYANMPLLGAGFNIPHAASTPNNLVNGDIWTETTGMFVRINGVTKAVTLT